MADIDCNLNLYQAPSIEILRHRREFYGLLQGSEEQTTTWLNRIQSQIDRCEFPSFMSREYLLIDKFVCALNDDEREFIRSVSTWTLMELNEYLANKEMRLNNEVEANSTTDIAIEQNPAIPMALITLKCEFVSNSTLYTTFF